MKVSEAESKRHLEAARVGPVGRPAIAEWRAESGHVGQQHCELSASCLDFYHKRAKTAHRKLTKNAGALFYLLSQQLNHLPVTKLARQPRNLICVSFRFGRVEPVCRRFAPILQLRRQPQTASLKFGQIAWRAF